MYKKTSSANFLKYGQPINSLPKDHELMLNHVSINDKTVNEFMCFDEDIYLSLDEGMGMLIIYDREYLEYAIHRNLRINRGVIFALVPMNDNITITLYASSNASFKKIIAPSSYTYKSVIPSFSIDEIIATYYVVKGPGYRFDGETHNYYELTYVDNGELITKIDDREYTLGTRDLCLYGPSQFHTQRVSNDNSCSYLTIIFKADNLQADHLLNRVFSSNKTVISLVEQFTDNSNSHLAYSDDLSISLLKMIIINLLQYNEKTHVRPLTPISQFFDDKLFEEIISYISNHIYEPLSVEDICDTFSISRSFLQNIFKNNLKTSPKLYINELKLKRSRELIKTRKYTINDISSMLGFSSIQYFSRKFTKRFGINPSEYARKIYES